ncbi:uncharacterized protein N7477_007823 [Penicillium maclennaniae]|uniref:uncharacterized protein n=1 Tax=Penicillium maclennaniae TaxID=1343394 RepID=UPI0025418A31|nr:uncharacterized protein N7477_007823 [Penicillium maclennaniae]KAJ5665375.1 hypothetical protein N7477_007823 [Penicillium maclennaniae]
MRNSFLFLLILIFHPDFPFEQQPSTIPFDTPTPSILVSADASTKPHSIMTETNGVGSAQMDLAAASTTQVRPGGAPARVYLNEKIVPTLLEGMKSIAKEQPNNPLRVLGEYLIQKSNELERDANRTE